CRISSGSIDGCGEYTFGLFAEGMSQYRVSGTPSIVGPSAAFCSHFAKSSVPGKGVSMTNCAKETPARCATSAVASKVAGVSVGSPKMNDPSTWTPCDRNACSLVTSASPAQLKFL